MDTLALEAGVALGAHPRGDPVVGRLLGMLPVLGFWMLPLGFILIAEDLPIVRRGVARVLEGLERRRPQWFSKPSGLTMGAFSPVSGLPAQQSLRAGI